MSHRGHGEELRGDALRGQDSLFPGVPVSVIGGAAKNSVQFPMCLLTH
jgi:hypothetical protein